MNQDMMWRAVNMRFGREAAAMEGPGTAFMNYIRDGICIADTDNRIVYWNRTAETVTGYASADVVGEVVLDRVFQTNAFRAPRHSEGKRNPLWTNHSQTHEHVSRSMVMHKSGRQVPVKLSASLISEEDGRETGTFIMFWDATTENELSEPQTQEVQVLKFLQNHVSRETFALANLHARGEVSPHAVQAKMTVMFIDIARFTAFAENADSDEVCELLNEFFSVCEMAVLNNNGDIDKFIGDCVMAVFQTPDEAVAAGKALLEVFRERNRMARELGAYELHVRLGAHTGPVVLGDIGGTSRKDCTVVGDAVNTAARLERLSDVDTLLISHATYTGLSNRTDFLFVGTTLIRGKSESMRLYVY